MHAQLARRGGVVRSCAAAPLCAASAPTLGVACEARECMTFEWEAGAGAATGLTTGMAPGAPWRLDAVLGRCQRAPTEVKRAIKSWQGRSKVRFSGEGSGFGDGEGQTGRPRCRRCLARKKPAENRLIGPDLNRTDRGKHHTSDPIRGDMHSWSWRFAYRCDGQRYPMRDGV